MSFKLGNKNHFFVTVAILLLFVGWGSVIVQSKSIDLTVQGQKIDSPSNMLIHKKRDTNDTKCEEFITFSPNTLNGLPTFANNTNVTVSWYKGKSLVTKCVDIELFFTKGLVSILWSSGTTFDSYGFASVTVLLRVPATNSQLQFGPGDSSHQFLLRTWGSTDQGPACTTYSTPFYIKVWCPKWILRNS